MRIHIPIPLRWGDLDAYNHVNNVHMLRILEEARVRALWAPEVGEPAPTAVLQATQGAVGGASTDIAYEVFSQGKLVVRAESTMVFIDAKTQRPRRISEVERAAWEPYFGSPIVFKRDAKLGRGPGTDR